MRRRVLLLSAIPVAILIVVGIWYSVFMPKNKEFVNMGEVNIDFVPVNVLLWSFNSFDHSLYMDMNYVPEEFLEIWRDTYRNMFTKNLGYSLNKTAGNIFIEYSLGKNIWWGEEDYVGEFYISLNITNIYVEKIMFFTDISEFNRSRGWIMYIDQYPHTEYEEKHWKHNRLKQPAHTEYNPYTYDKVYINTTGLNYTEEYMLGAHYVGWDKPRIKVIVYVETREKVYYATFYIRFIKEQYHFVSKPVNATYYCFNNTTKSLTISDEIVDGTDYYFFINEDGKMSFIKEVKDNE